MGNSSGNIGNKFRPFMWKGLIFLETLKTVCPVTGQVAWWSAAQIVISNLGNILLSTDIWRVSAARSAAHAENVRSIMLHLCWESNIVKLVYGIWIEPIKGDISMERPSQDGHGMWGMLGANASLITCAVKVHPLESHWSWAPLAKAARQIKGSQPTYQKLTPREW